jgi:hypothetical protein
MALPTVQNAMATNQLVLESRTFQIARWSLVVTCKLFLGNPNPLNTP